MVRRPFDRPRAARRGRAAALALALASLAALAPTGQARPAREHVLSERQLRALSLERTNGVLTITCTSVTWTFREFPNLPGNTVTEQLKVNRVKTTSTFTFDGSTGTHVTPIDAPPGSYIIDGRGRWRRGYANGASGSFDIHAKVTCPPRPDMAVEKLQRIEGGDGAYTSASQTGEVGQTIGYEIVVRNSGNVPMTVDGLSDPRCDAGTITGGPAGGVLATSATSAYVCTHVITAADLAAGSYANTVTLTGTPPQGDGAPKTKTSNTVVTEIRPARTPPAEKEKAPATTAPSPTVGAPGKTGVLEFSSASVPSLKGPHGCVRGKFHASVRSTGVARVTYYLDGRKLRKLTAHSARGGLLSVTADARRLRAGKHRLVAKITMNASAGARAVEASRRTTVVRCGRRARASSLAA